MFSFRRGLLLASARVDQSMRAKPIRATPSRPVSMRRSSSEVREAIPKNTPALIRLVSESKGGRFRGAPKVEFELASITMHGTKYTASSSKDEVTKEGRGKRTGKFAVIGGAVGAAVGGITHGGKGLLRALPQGAELAPVPPASPETAV